MKIKVLFVCLGNIYRSPLAEGIFRYHVQKRGLAEQFEIDSCGTAAYHIGEHPDVRSVSNAAKNGIDYDHLGRQFVPEDFMRFDYILPMDDSNYEDIMMLSPVSPKAEVFKLRYFDDEAPSADVPDPYYGGEKGFQEVFDILKRSTSKFLEELIEKHQLAI